MYEIYYPAEMYDIEFIISEEPKHKFGDKHVSLWNKRSK